jgi:hypothetical protein
MGPAPLLVFPADLEPYLRVVNLLDVFSLNHIEPATLFGIDILLSTISRSKTKELAHRCLQSGIGIDKSGAIGVRVSEASCCLFSKE